MARPLGAAAGAWTTLLIAILASAAATVRANLVDGAERYLIASFPSLGQVQYARLRNPTWLPLITSALGVTTPQAIAVDHVNHRLFIYDAAIGGVVFYQLHVLDDRRLVTDGHRHVAVGAMSAGGLAVDSVGSLYVAGRSMPTPAAAASEGIFKQDAIAIATAASVGDSQVVPKQIWSRGNTVAASTPNSPQLYEPSGIAVDPFNVYWGNKGRGGSSVVGSVVKAPISALSVHPENAVHAMSDNVDLVTSLALTPLNIFYATEGSVYAVPVGKTAGSCGSDGSHCPQVAVAEGLRATGLIWDGDGTVYVADNGRGAIYGLPSGSATAHALELVVDAPGVFAVSVLDARPDTSAACGRCAPTAAALLAAFAAVLGLCAHT